MTEPERFSAGDLVSLVRAGRKAIITRLQSGTVDLEGLGVVDLREIIGAAPGRRVAWVDEEFVVLRPSLDDLLSTIHRGAQVVVPKDAVYLSYLAGVGPGCRVAEAGSGSGALALVLAHAVGAEGHVTSYDRRGDFLAIAKSNIERSGLGARVEFVERDVARFGFERSGFHSVLLDLPEPWSVVATSWTALDSGGYLATYTPTYNQLERTVRSMREAGFQDVKARELLERTLHVGEGGTRPEFDMLGHTGFLASGRKVA